MVHRAAVQSVKAQGLNNMAKTKEQWSRISEDLVAALDRVAQKHKVTFESHGFRYGDDECTFKTRATMNDADGNKKDMPRLAYIERTSRDSYSYGGLKKEWLDKTFGNGKHRYTILGLEPGKKYCVVTRRDDGETRYCTTSFVVEGMKEQQTPETVAA